MAIEKREYDCAKEIDDVLQLVVEVIKDVKDGKGASAIAAENLPGLMTAISGADQALGEHAQNPSAVYATVGKAVGEIAGALLTPAPQAPEAA
jgi:hypothetical protein